jgi:hypothetical protein
MVVHWIPDRDGTGGPTTLSIDGLGPAPVRGPDGASDPVPGGIVGGQMYQIWYDGSRFRLLATAGGSSAAAASRYAVPMAGTTVYVSAATHGKGTTPTIAGCRDSSGLVYEPGLISVNDSGDVTIASATAMTGHCYIAGLSAGSGQYVATMAQASMTIMGATHGLGTNPVLGGCYDGSNNGFEPGSVIVNDYGDVTITSAVAMTGKCVLR